VACLFLALAWLGTPIVGRAQAPGEPIAAVRVEGLSSARAKSVAKDLKTQPGQPYSPMSVREDVQSLSEQMRTVTVSAEPTGAHRVLVRFRVAPYPRLRRLDIVGNRLLKTDRIVTLLAMEPGKTILDSHQLESAKRALDREYDALGVPQTRVRLSLIDLSDGDADLQILLDEGKPLVCRGLIFHGNRAFSATRLKSHLKTAGSLWLIKNYYDDATMDEDLGTLRDFYAAHGYFDARVRRGAFLYDGQGAQAAVSPVVEIDEGTRYVLGSVVARGARLYSQVEIVEPFERLRGKPFDGEAFAEALKRVRALYFDHGLLNTEIKTDQEYDAVRHELNLVLSIAESDRVYVGKILLKRPKYKDDGKINRLQAWHDRKAPPVKDEVVMREILLAPGDVYNRRLEQDSLRRLEKLNVFKQDKLKVTDRPTEDPNVHDMVIEAQDAETGNLMVGIGFGDEYGLYAYASATESNVGGRADVFSTGAIVGVKTSSIEVKYLNRHLGQTRDSLASRAFVQRQYYTGYHATTVGLHEEWSHRFHDDWTRSLRARFEYVQLGHNHDTDETAEDLDRSYGVATLRLKFEQDTRRPIGGGSSSTREGYLQAFSVEAGYAGASMLNFQASRDQYTPLTTHLTWRFYGMAGIMPFDADRVPIQERYFMGGANDLRGFKYRGAGYYDSKNDDVPIGGATKLLAKNELLYPLFDPVTGVFFVDAGDMGDSPDSWQSPRVSTGLGVRFDMKKVQVGLDAVLPVVKESQDKTRFFDFSIQTQF
jgi:outer membrane protein insertion porin family